MIKKNPFTSNYQHTLFSSFTTTAFNASLHLCSDPKDYISTPLNRTLNLTTSVCIDNYYYP